MSGQVRGCGGTLRTVIRGLEPHELGAFATAGERAHAVCEHPDGTVFAYAGIPTPGEQLAHECPDLNGAPLNDWIDNSPEAQQNLRVAQVILDQQGKISDLAEAKSQMHKQESIMVRHLLEWRDLVDKAREVEPPVVRVDAQSVALAIGALMLACDLMTSTAELDVWLHDRVAAADLNRREPHGKVDVWVDARSADRACAVLRYLVAVGRAHDVEVYELAALDFAAALAPLTVEQYRTAPIRGEANT